MLFTLLLDIKGGSLISEGRYFRGGGGGGRYLRPHVYVECGPIFAHSWLVLRYSKGYSHETHYQTTLGETEGTAQVRKKLPFAL